MVASARLILGDCAKLLTLQRLQLWQAHLPKATTVEFPCRTQAAWHVLGKRGVSVLHGSDLGKLAKVHVLTQPVEMGLKLTVMVHHGSDVMCICAWLSGRRGRLQFQHALQGLQTSQLTVTVQKALTSPSPAVGLNDDPKATTIILQEGSLTRRHDNSHVPSSITHCHEITKSSQDDLIPGHCRQELKL